MIIIFISIFNNIFCFYQLTPTIFSMLLYHGKISSMKLRSET